MVAETFQHFQLSAAGPKEDLARRHVDAGLICLRDEHPFDAACGL
jgi:hypothetical protein